MRALALAGALLALGGSSVVAKVPTGGTPCGVAGAAGFVWVTDASSGELLKIDPASHAVVARTKLDATPCELREAAGSLWVVTHSGKLDRVDPATGEVTARIAVGRATYDVAHAFGSLWVTNRESGTVQRIDPARNAVVKTLRFPGQKPAGIVASASAIWVGDDYGSEVRRLDPRTYRWSKVRTRQLGSSWLAAAGPVVWVSNTLSNTVTRIDARRRVATRTVKVGRSPVNLEVIGGEVWVPNDGDATLSRVSSAGTLIETVKTSGNPAVVAGVGGDVWASIFDAGEVWQIRPS